VFGNFATQPPGRGSRRASDTPSVTSSICATRRSRGSTVLNGRSSSNHALTPTPTAADLRCPKPRSNYLAHEDNPCGGCAYYALLATVAALYSVAGPITPPLCGRRTQEVRKLTLLMATALMLAMMLASAGMASASPLNGAAHAPTEANFGIATALFHFGSLHGPPS
jgi:hypothetical protein